MSFLTDYTIFASGNECPGIYHTWSGLSSISNLVSRKVWVDMGFYVVRPQMYVVLVGRPGIKKSTAMKISRRLIYEVGELPIAPASITKEAMTQMMAEEGSPCKKVFRHEDKVVHYSHLSVYANELTSLLSAGGSPVGMIDFLTDIWDQDVMEVKTKNKGTDLVVGPFISLLGCMTPEIMANFLFQKIISGGFTRRCIFVYADHNGPPIPRPTITEEQKLAWERCVKAGERIKVTQGEFKLTEQAEAVFDTWYCQNHALCATGGPAVMQGFYQSKGEYVLKVAMLIALSETSKLSIEPEHVLASIDFLTQIEPGLSIVFEGTGRNELSPIASEIERFLVAMPKPIKKKMLYKQFYQSANHDEIDSMVTHLLTVNKIAVVEVVISGTPLQFIATPTIMEQWKLEGGQWQTL